MSFTELYDLVQKQAVPIKTNWLRETAIALSGFKGIKEQWSSVIEELNLRGFYLEGPLGPPVTVEENAALIVLSRSMCRGHQGEYWRRFVLTKELMHVFDTPEEKADTEEKFDRQAEKFGDPAAPKSAMYSAEEKAVYRALACLCPEEHRLAFKAAVLAGDATLEMVGAALRIPAGWLPELFREDFLDRVQHSK